MTTICFCSICCNWICHLMDYTYKKGQPLNRHSSMLIRMLSCSNYNNYLSDNNFINLKCVFRLVKLLCYAYYEKNLGPIIQIKSSRIQGLR